MKTKLLLAAFALLLSNCVTPLSTAHAQGALTPPGAPAPTMKTLDQIEARTPISSAPYTISAPGSYYLTTNLLVFVNNGIVIAASNVTLDLNGYTIHSTQNPATTGKAIALGNGSGPVANVTIRNGFITGGVTNNGTTFGGSGFGYGIFQFGGQPSINVHVSGVSVSGCLYVGIHLGGSNTVVESCSVNMVGSYGIYAQTIADSTAQNCGIYAIYATSSANNCSGTGIISGYGLSAYSAYNCYGTSITGTGLSASCAENCYGTCSNGTGLYAALAQNCYGSSNGQTADGIYGYSLQNCEGDNNSSGFGIYATSIANGCIGYSKSGTGIYAFIANSCNGITTTGTALSTTHNVNSF